MDEAESKRRLDALKIARQLLNEEYIARRSEEYNKWLVDSQVAWRTQGTKLPPPSAAVAYPSEQEVVAKALEYYNFVTAGEQQTEFKPASPQPAAVATPEPVVSATPLVEPTPAPVAEPVVEIVEPVKEKPKYEEPISPPVPDTPRVKPQRIATAPTPSTAANAIPATNNSQITKLTKAILDTNSTLPEAVPPELKPLFANSAVASLPVTANTPPATSTTGLKGVLPAWLQRLHGITKE